ncbi:Type II secretory pathway, pseudopilin [Idiomarina sp. OT37-5b]|uniref:type IV pilin protein n=1 Tax=Idiomarina sp. OT37-5b TaxID=2100422 RepID=UPI000CF843D6|nr:type II secretion system protein [Idiomarina sp. OT37-5b]AVJ55071.1 Type II secretory pathway, pseudopilin [Idiomarina sp. OT37-5b]
MRNQKGFTLIELIIVIVVLGILAVTAAPQFIDFSSDARTSTVKGLKGAVQAAQQTINARAAIDGDLGATGNVNGVDTIYGYPAASESGIVAAAQLSTINAVAGPGADRESVDWAFTVVEDTGANGEDTIYLSPVDFAAVGAALDGTNGCYLEYTEAGQDGDGNLVRPVIEVNSSEC